MTSSSGVDVEGLFRKFTVPEIRDIEKKVKTDIERKKEDLRQMVGRRYRDIIEAADSIRDMKLRADDILVSVKDVQKGFDRLHLLQQQLMAAQQRAHMSNHSPVDPELCIDAQLKLFQDLPELIWECLDEEDVLSAVWFVLFAENLHRCLGLTLPSNVPSYASKKRILDRYAGRIQNLRQLVLEKCNSKLNTQGWMKLEDTNFCLDCLCAVACLESLSASDVLDRLLVGQKNSLSVMFDDPESSSREQFCNCLAALQWTLLNVFEIFATDDLQEEHVHSALTEKISSIRSGCWQPESFGRYLSHQSRTFSLALPSDIRQFHPSFSKEISDLQQNSVRDALGTWIQQCLDMSRDNLSSSLVYFESVEALTVLKRSILETLSKVEQAKWSVACRKTLSSELPLWDILIKDLLDKRLEDLVSLSVEASFSQLKAAVSQRLSSHKEKSFEDLTFNFGKYMWTEMNSDTPRISGNVGMSSLTLKARGIPPDIYNVCRSLDESLLNLQESLEKHYDIRVSKEENGITQRKRTRICSVSGDLPEIWKCLAEACSKAVNGFLHDMERNIAAAVDLCSESQCHVGLFGFVRQAQICFCLCELCPGLKSCMAYQSCLPLADETLGGMRPRKGQDTELWKSTKASLSALAVNIYKRWTDLVVKKAANAAGFLKRETDANLWNEWLDESQEWESVSVEEETEMGEKVTSKLQVPVQCSRNLHKFLIALCLSMNTLGAHRVPKMAVAIFTQSSMYSLIGFFETVLDSFSTGRKLSQKQALQLLFDIKIVAGLFLKSASSEEQSVLQKKLAEFTERFQSCIDPFDLDVLNPHMKRNITKFYHKILSLYGVIILSETATNLSRTAGTKIVAGSEQPQLLPVASGVSRFQLLPVAAPAKTDLITGRRGIPVVHLHAAVSSVNVGSLENKRDSKKGKDDLPKSSSSTTLSSFYDKISSSWFGM